MGIQVGESYNSILFSMTKHSQAFQGTVHSYPLKAAHKNTAIGAFSDSYLCVFRVNQVQQILHVDLHIWNLHRIRMLRVFRNVLKYLLKCPWSYASILRIWVSHHRIGFTSSCLSVAEYCAIYPFYNALNHGLSNLRIQLSLCTFRVQKYIKLELSLFEILFDHHYGPLKVHMFDADLSILLFFIDKGP